MHISVKLTLLVTTAALVAIGISAAIAYPLIFNALQHHTSTSSSSLSQATIQLTATLALVFLVVAGVITLITVIILNRQVMLPIRSLSAAITRITLGDLSQTVPVHSGDELGILSKNFNEMTRQLAASHRNLQATTQVAKEGQAQLESSINSLRQGFILTDFKNNIIMANVAALEMIRSKNKTGFKKPSEIKLSDIASVLPEDLKLTKKITQTLQGRRLAKFPNLPLGGRFLNLYLSPVINGDEAIGCALLLEDVTEERIMQRSRDEFFSIASHELRTPLTAIRGNTAMIQRYFPEAVKDTNVKEMISDINNSAVRLIAIVNDFLDVSRLEQDKMKITLTTFPLEPAIEKVVYEMAGLSRDKEISLEFDHNTLGTLPDIYADEDRIKQVIYNLIGNAMKFTQQGKVTISTQIEKHFLKVYITDTGIGISPEGQQILFHKFQQSASSILTRDNTRGTGLGLYISKLLMEHMGGTIQLEYSELGKGSTFSFTLPLATKTQVKAKAS